MKSSGKTIHTLEPDKWIDNYSDMLYAFTVSRVSDREVAKDIVQDTFLSAWKARDGYKGEASEKSWLFTICRNKIIDHYRRSTLKTIDLQAEEEQDFFDKDDGHWTKAASPHDWAVNYTDTVETKEFYEVLTNCKGKLKEQQQAVFTMKYLEEMDSEDICKVLDITPSNYWVLVHRAKVHLRKCIEKNWFDNI